MNFMCFIYGKQIWNPLYYRYYSTADFLWQNKKGHNMSNYIMDLRKVVGHGRRFYRAWRDCRGA